MHNQGFSRLLLIDLGYPMDKNTLKLIKTSLLNVMSLMRVYSTNSFLKIFGISVINSDFTIIKSSTCPQKFYNELIKIIDNLDNNETSNLKVTIQEYKNFLKNSLETIIKEFPLNLRELNKKNTQLVDNETNLKIHIALITKKTASLVNDILKDVFYKLLVKKHLENMMSNIKFKVIQILNDDTNNSNLKHKSIKPDCIMCCCDEEVLNSVLKDYLLKSECDVQPLQICLSKDPELIIKCDMENCILDPAFMRFELELCNDFMFHISTANSVLGALRKIDNLEILYKIPISGICPSLLFGFSRRAYASDHSLSWPEEEFNQHIFTALCRNLAETQQGLLSKSNIQSHSSGSLNTYCFITSDGNTLLLNLVAPEELHLSKRPETFMHNFIEDKNATLIIQNSLERIHGLNLYVPSKFSSGLYIHFRNQLSLTNQNSIINTNENKNLNFKTNWKKKNVWKCSLNKKNLQTMGTQWKNSKNFHNKQKACHCHQEENNKKISKDTYNIKHSNIHPALLSPNTAQKYSKTYMYSYQPPELNFAYEEI